MGIFVPRTQPEILGDMINRFTSVTPINDLNFGSVFFTSLEAAAQEDDEQYFQMLEIVEAFNIDNLEGNDLDARAFEYGIERQEEAEATTTVTLGDTAVTKVETGVFSGLPGAPAGTSKINGNVGTGFPTTGTVIIGRGTPNVETVAYTSITTFANYVQFNLAANLANDHGTDETIILSQGGNRTFPDGQNVLVPASDTLEQITFTLDEEAVILDGESEVTGVAVTATEPGTIGNVPVGAIKVVESPPFPTATVRNPARVTNGRDEESDQQLRDRIKSTIQSLSKGTAVSILNAINGLVSTDNKRVVSSTLRDVTLPSDVVKVFIDDGSGFIPSFARIGFEVVVDSATGGEKFLRTVNTPLVKAFVETEAEEPFNIQNNETLFVDINGVAETITFVDSDFEAPGAASAQEVLEKINQVSQLFEARLSSDGAKVRIFARDNSNEEIQVTGGTANASLAFPTDKKFTTKLYLIRDNVTTLLSKDGRTASIEAGASAAYDFSGEEVGLTVVVDGKIRSLQNIWFNPSQFANPAFVNAQEAADRINSDAVGFKCETSSNLTRISLFSMLERSSASKVRVVEAFTHVFNEEAAVYVDRTAQAKDDALNFTSFAVDGEYLYLGHDEVPFNTVFMSFITPASASIQPTFEYYKGGVTNAFTLIGVDDRTNGLQQDGTIRFMAPLDWVKTTFEGVEAYWLRIRRNEPSALIPPTESRILVCGANQQFAFSETEVVGTNKDYTLNRFMGQIELVNPLQQNDRVTLGSNETRASVATSNTALYSGLSGKTLNLLIDGVAQSINFVGGDFADDLNISAAEVVTALNARLDGILATSIEADTRVKIRTNTIDNGSIQVTGGTANDVLAFPTTLVSNLDTHQASIQSSLETFTFAVNDSVIFVIDGNLQDNFTVPLYNERTASATAGDASTLIDASLNATFPLAVDLIGFDLEMIDGDEAGERRTISNYDPNTGTITLSAPLSGIPDSGEKFQVLPTTAKHIQKFWNNSFITILNNKAEIRTSDSGRRIQIASLTLGENGSIAVTGGNGNLQLNFPASDVGVDAYRYFTGLAQLVQWTIDGKEDDRETYEGYRAAGVQVEVIEPVKKPQFVSLTMTTQEGVALGSVTEPVKSAVSNYINTLGVGDDVIVSEIVVAVKAVTGVADVVVEVPTENEPIADNELARINEDDIIVG
jgi:uncharacterized phage protein gp47/JayE